MLTLTVSNTCCARFKHLSFIVLLHYIRFRRSQLKRLSSLCISKLKTFFSSEFLCFLLLLLFNKLIVYWTQTKPNRDPKVTRCIPSDWYNGDSKCVVWILFEELRFSLLWIWPWPLLCCHHVFPASATFLCSTHRWTHKALVCLPRCGHWLIVVQMFQPCPSVGQQRARARTPDPPPRARTHAWMHTGGCVSVIWGVGRLGGGVVWCFF